MFRESNQTLHNKFIAPPPPSKCVYRLPTGLRVREKVESWWNWRPLRDAGQNSVFLTGKNDWSYGTQCVQAVASWYRRVEFRAISCHMLQIYFLVAW